MVPPLLAYSGVLSDNSTLLREAYNQCKLYRQYLKAKNSNAVQHVVLGRWHDRGVWNTGNGWFAAGNHKLFFSPVSLFDETDQKFSQE